MAKANDQMPDLGKSINVFNNNPNVKNPFLRNNSSQPTPSNHGTARSSDPAAPSENSSAPKNITDAI